MEEIRKLYKIVWPEGKDRAFTMSYDDGIRQDARLISLMNRYGIKGTFNINSGRFGLENNFTLFGKTVDTSTFSAEEIPEVYKGFEISTHGVTHSSLMNIGALAVTEIAEDRKALEKITGTIVQGHAYPYGRYDEGTKNILRACGIRYARTITSTHSFELPDDFLEWNPTCHHTEECMMELGKQFCERHPMLAKNPMLFYLWGHTYEFDQFDNWNIIEEFLAYIAQYKDSIWFASNIEIYRYIQASRQLEFSADGTAVYNPASTEIWFDAAVFGTGKIVRLRPGETTVL